MDLADRLDVAWRHLDDADRDAVVDLAEDLAADRQSWWDEQGREREEAPPPPEGDGGAWSRGSSGSSGR